MYMRYKDHRESVLLYAGQTQLESAWGSRLEAGLLGRISFGSLDRAGKASRYLNRTYSKKQDTAAGLDSMLCLKHVLVDLSRVFAMFRIF